MSATASQITCVSIVCSIVCIGVDQRRHQSSTLLVFGRGIHLWPVDSPHKGPVTRKMFPFDDVIMYIVPIHVSVFMWESKSVIILQMMFQHLTVLTAKSGMFYAHFVWTVVNWIYGNSFRITGQWCKGHPPERGGFFYISKTYLKVMSECGRSYPEWRLLGADLTILFPYSTDVMNGWSRLSNLAALSNKNY